LSEGRAESSEQTAKRSSDKNEKVPFHSFFS
jgi:hypothetical protein